MKRQTLETRIAELVRPILASNPNVTFDVLALELWGNRREGFEVNTPFRILTQGKTLDELQEAARGRWEVFKCNYAPRATVASIDHDNGEDRPTCLYLEADNLPFLEIRFTYPDA